MGDVRFNRLEESDISEVFHIAMNKFRLLSRRDDFIGDLWVLFLGKVVVAKSYQALDTVDECRAYLMRSCTNFLLSKIDVTYDKCYDDSIQYSYNTVKNPEQELIDKQYGVVMDSMESELHRLYSVVMGVPLKDFTIGYLHKLANRINKLKRLNIVTRFKRLYSFIHSGDFLLYCKRLNGKGNYTGMVKSMLNMNRKTSSTVIYNRLVGMGYCIKRNALNATISRIRYHG